MVRLSKLTDYATVILSFMAKGETRVCAAMEIACATGIAQPTVSKILKLLANANVVISTRGAKGGYALADKPENITLAVVISAVEGPIALTECSISKQACDMVSACGISSNWSLINTTIQRALNEVTLADMIKPMVCQSAKEQEITIPLASLCR